MFRIRRFLKPFIGFLLIAVVLLFGQALCDLNLPNYMSNIVNVGLQQNGIESPTPEKISPNGKELMQVFMSNEDKELVNNSYTLSKDGSKYTLNKLSSKEIEVLDKAFEKSSWGFVSFMKEIVPEPNENIEGTTEATTEETTNEMQALKIDQMYELLPMFKMLPEQKINELLSTYDTNSSMVANQVSIQLNKSFYEELGEDMLSYQTNYIIKIGLIMLLIALLGSIATVLVNLISSKIGAGIGRDLRHSIFKKVESFSNEEFDKFGAASLITRTTNDVQQVQMLLVMGIRMICYAPIMGIGGIMMALNKSSSMSWIIGVAVIVLIGLIMVIFALAMPKFKVVQKLIDKLNLVSRENLTGIMVIRAFGTQKFEENRFDKANLDVTKVNKFVGRVMAFMMPAMTLVMNCITLLIVWVGAHQIADSAMQVGDMMAYMQYAMQIIMSFLMIAMMFVFIPRASVSASRIADVLAVEPKIVDKPETLDFKPRQKGVVEFRNVCFKYGGADENVLENINFIAKPGQTTAFIGSTGSGKTTLINLIPRFYDVTEGEILVGGVNIKDVKLESLHEQIGYVPQKGSLFSGTIGSNLRYGKEKATDEEVLYAVEVAQATEFVSKTPNGLATQISQGGANVSGGQKQRLSIARALVCNAPINIFDDTFSALDFKTDAALRKALAESTGGSTVLIVAQRVSTIMHADQIIVLDEGKVVGKGTHEELLKSCTQYYEIASSQLGEEEL
ncbi:MAG: ABC transporter ATP-binding protein [Clostridia bacterium]